MNVLLDEAAAHAMAGQQIDLDLVLRRAAEQNTLRGRRTWRRGGAAALAVAAVAVLIAVLLPGSGVLRGDAGPAGQDRRVAPVPPVTGIPVSWYYAPVWTPPVTRHPMAAAVMVLSVPLVSGSIGGNGWSGRGPVLVSADAKVYASLPGWGAHDGGVALSPDGRRVAWWTAGEKDGAGPSALVKPLVVHMLTLASGQRRDVTLPRAVPGDMSWYGEDLFLSGPEWLRSADASGTNRASRYWRVDGVTGAVSQQICPCWKRGIMTLSNATGGPDLTIASGGLNISPDDGLEQAIVQVLDAKWSVGFVRFSGPGLASPDWPVTADEPVTGVHLLAWTRAGLVLAVDSSDGLRAHHSIRVMDPKTGKSTVVSRPHETSVPVPVAVATGLITSAEPIVAAPPSFDDRDRSHLTFLARLAWSLYGRWIEIGLVLLVAAVAGLVVWRRRVSAGRVSAGRVGVGQ